MKTLKDLQHHMQRLEAAIEKLSTLDDDYLITTGRNNLRLDFIRSWKSMPFSTKLNAKPPISLRPNYLLRGLEGVRSELEKQLQTTERNIESLKRKK